MPIDDRTTNRSYKLPNAGNNLADDVVRLRDALAAIDADVYARYTKTEVNQLITNLINGAPGALDTLNELAAALGNDANFATTVATQLALKANASNVYSKAESDARYVQGQTQAEMVFTATAGQSVFTLSTAVINKPSALVTVDGVVQPTSEYSINMAGTQLTLSEGVPAGTVVRVLALGVSSAGAPADDTVTTEKLRDGAVTTEKLANGIAPTVASINGGPLAGTRNRIINGGMAVDQRNAGAAHTITNGVQSYTIDRWFAYSFGASVTGQRVQGATAGQYRYQITGAAGVTSIGFGQRIEQLNSADLAGTTATLSVDLANSLLTTITWTAFYANTTDTFTATTQFASGTFTVNSTVTRYSTQISIPAAATTGLQIVFTVGAQTSGTWTIGNVQLEAGSVATPFERRSYGQELALCQRYLETIEAGGALPNGIAFTCSNRTAGEAPVTHIIFKVTKRAAPVASFSTPSSVRYVCNNGVFTGNNAVAQYINQTGMTLSCSSTPAASFGWMDSFGTISLSAEL